MLQAEMEIQNEIYQRDAAIAQLQGEVASHNQKVSDMKLRHLRAMQRAELKFMREQQAPEQSFPAKHWPTAASLCCGVMTLGAERLSLVPWPEIVVPLSVACTVGVLLYFVFRTIHWAIRTMKGNKDQADYAE